MINILMVDDHLIVRQGIKRIIDDVADMNMSDFEPVFDGNTEVILLGTGTKQVFPKKHLLSKILTRGLGIEVMDSISACRTFNLLVSEYRRPLAMLMLE
mgnify:CR=1 FL=1